MKIQCNVCETDEAALCWSCDEKLHTANKLAEKHQRVPLSVSSSSIPKCDICQDAGAVSTWAFLLMLRTTLFLLRSVFQAAVHSLWRERNGRRLVRHEMMILPVSRKIISSMTYQWVGSSISQVSLGHLECLLEVQASLPCSKYVLYICV
ncbi:hypothetical protein Bca4012_036363 [Brassica carinata]